MESMQIEIVNPKAKRLINTLADMDLIRIKKEESTSEFNKLLKRLRRHAQDTPSLEEITEEVELVRKSRYEK